jgi:hypothetical protein
MDSESSHLKAPGVVSKVKRPVFLARDLSGLS